MKKRSNVKEEKGHYQLKLRCMQSIVQRYYHGVHPVFVESCVSFHLIASHLVLLYLLVRDSFLLYFLFGLLTPIESMLRSRGWLRHFLLRVVNSNDILEINQH